MACWRAADFPSVPPTLRQILPLALALTAVSPRQAQASPFTAPYGATATARLNSMPRGGDNVTFATDGGDRETSALVGVHSVNDAFGADTVGSGTAYASLAKGTVGAKVEFSENENGPTGYVSGDASAQIWDTVTLIPGEGVFNYRIPMQLALDGRTDIPIPSAGLGSASVSLSVYDADTFALVQEAHGRTTEGLLLVSADLTPDLVSPLVPKRYIVSYGLSVFGNMANAGEPMRMGVDYFNTLHFNWSLPSGVTYTSESGLFHPGAIQAVPEPASMAALAVGTVGLLRRRRRS
jgi:hypothetical protein